MPDRTLNWGPSSTDAVYQTGDADPTGGGNFVVAEDTDAGTVLLEWDATAEEWVSRGPVEMSGEDVTGVGAFDSESVSTGELGNGPIAFSSEFNSIQDGLDAAAGGTLVIDDTKTEEAIHFGEPHNGTTVVWIGDNWIEQPSDFSQRQSVIDIEPTDGITVRDVTLVRPQIRNPSLSDGDILNDDTFPDADSAGGIALPSQQTQSDVSTPVSVEGWTIIDPHIHHLQGFGIRFFRNIGENQVRGGNIYRVAMDCIYFREFEPEVKCVARDVTLGWAGRHNIAVASESSGPSHDHVSLSGYGEDAYLAGVDLEDGKNVEFDMTLRNTTRTDSAGQIANGVNIGSGSENTSGRVHIINPGNYAARVRSFVDGLKIISEREDGADQNPEDVAAVFCEGGATGNLEVIIRGGGSESNGALLVDEVTDTLAIDANIRDAYGPSARVARSEKVELDLVSVDPGAGGTGLASENRSHLAVNDYSGVSTTDCVVGIVAQDDRGNVENAIIETGESADWNRYSGNVRNAYSNSATSGLGSNSDASDLLG